MPIHSLAQRIGSSQGPTRHYNAAQRYPSVSPSSRPPFFAPGGAVDNGMQRMGQGFFNGMMNLNNMRQPQAPQPPMRVPQGMLSGATGGMQVPHSPYTPEQIRHLASLQNTLSEIQQISAGQHPQQIDSRVAGYQPQPYQPGMDFKTGQINVSPGPPSGYQGGRFGAPPGTSEYNKTSINPVTGSVTIGPNLSMGQTQTQQPQPYQQEGQAPQQQMDPQRQTFAQTNLMSSNLARLSGQNYYDRTRMENIGPGGESLDGPATYDRRLTPTAQGILGQQNAMGVKLGDMNQYAPEELALSNLQNMLAYKGVDAANMNEQQARSALAQEHRKYVQGQAEQKEGRMANVRARAADEAMQRRNRIEYRRNGPSLLERALVQNPALAMGMLQMQQNQQQFDQRAQFGAQQGDRNSLIGLLDVLSRSEAGQPYLAGLLGQLGLGRPAESAEEAARPTPKPAMRAPVTKKQKAADREPFSDRPSYKARKGEVFRMDDDWRGFSGY